MILNLDLEVGEGNLERTIIASLFSLFMDKMEDLDSKKKNEALELFSKAQLGLSTWKELEEQSDEPIEVLVMGVNKVRIKEHLKELNKLMSSLMGEDIKYFVDKGQLVEMGFDGRINVANKVSSYEN